MDEVMADMLSEHIRRYNQTFDHDVRPGDLAGKGLWEIGYSRHNTQLPKSPGFFYLFTMVTANFASSMRALVYHTSDRHYRSHAYRRTRSAMSYIGHSLPNRIPVSHWQRWELQASF